MNLTATQGWVLAAMILIGLVALVWGIMTDNKSVSAVLEEVFAGAFAGAITFALFMWFINSILNAIHTQE